MIGAYVLAGVCAVFVLCLLWEWYDSPSERLFRRLRRFERLLDQVEKRGRKERRGRLPPCSLVRLPGPISRWRRIWWWLRPGRVL